ncbi:DUF3761 domain-containing protein [Mycobacterium sp.]|uniref:DUF3761 domain-containing protein n=1 Tax=Mycobacterium sp. TaxID=1785 RepID=UPI003F9BD1DE
MFRFLFMVAAIAGAVGVASTTTAVPPVTSPGWIAEPPYDDCPPGQYRGSSGNCVPSPNSSDGNVTAICRDGTHSHAEHATGACSHHGGVAQWCPCNFTSGQPILSWKGPVQLGPRQPLSATLSSVL